MREPLLIRVETTPLARVRCDCLAASFFSDERPLRGAAGRIDWRLCGQVTEILASGLIAGHAREAVLLPGSRSLRADRVLLLGLGERRSLGQSEVQDAAREMVARSASLGAARIALAPPVTDDDVARHADALVAAALEALAGQDGRLELSLLLQQHDPSATLQALDLAAARRPGAVELRTPNEAQAPRLPASPGVQPYA